MKIFCIGRNYANHAKELNNSVPDSPVIFMKPPSAIFKGESDYYIPDWTKKLQYEAELIVKIAKNGKNIQPEFAAKYYDEIGLGIDFTARDIQEELKQKKLPWELAKAFDNSAIIGRFFPKDSFSEPSFQFSLTKNGEEVQAGNTADMIFSIDQIIAYVSKFFTLQKGDIIFTGTPEGVGKIDKNEKYEGFFMNHQALSFTTK